MILASDMVEKYADAIIDKCIKDILMKTREPNEGAEEWVKDNDLGVECRAKVYSPPQVKGIQLMIDACFEDPGK